MTLTASCSVCGVMVRGMGQTPEKKKGLHFWSPM
jgi:hypothetical protein